jgi:hypothetical protein
MLLEPETTAAYSPPPRRRRERIGWLSHETGVDAIRPFRPREGAERRAPETGVSAQLGSDPRQSFDLLTGSSVTTWTQFITAAPDAAKEYAAKQDARHDVRRRLNAEIEARLEDLIVDALFANEPYSLESLSNLLTFMGEISFTRRPAIYLLDNGNFRAVWRNAENEQAAFQLRRYQRGRANRPGDQAQGAQ